MHKRLTYLGLLVTLFFTSCVDNSERSIKICEGATIGSYIPTFKVWCPAVQSDNYVDVKYGCPPLGKGVSPPVRWSGIPQGATRLRIQIEDATCTYECNDCCRFHHWILDFSLNELPKTGPFFVGGIEEGAATAATATQFSLPNTIGKRVYMPFCPPKIQTHAFIIEAIAYHLDGSAIKIDGRSQSVPFLYTLEKTVSIP